MYKKHLLRASAIFFLIFYATAVGCSCSLTSALYQLILNKIGLQSELLFTDNSIICKLHLEAPFVYKGQTFTPNQLYGSKFAQEAYSRLAALGPDYIKLLYSPDVIYRLDEFELFKQSQENGPAEQVSEAFMEHLGPHPLPPLTKGESYLLGDLPGLRGDLLTFIDTLPNRYGHELIELNLPLAGRLFSRRFLVLSPSLAQEIFNDTSGIYVKGELETNLQTNIFYPEALLFMKATDRWKLLNKAMLAGPFNPKQFPNRYGTIFTQNFYWLKDRWEKSHQPFDLFKDMTYYTMRTMGQALFDVTLPDKQLAEIADSFAFMLNYQQQREVSVMNIPFSIPTPGNREFLRHRAVFRDLIKKISIEAPHTISVNGITYPTIVGILHQHRDPDGSPLSLEEIMGHVSVLFFAGHVTTSIFTTMLLYHLYTSPEWHSIIATEMDDKLKDRRTGWYPMDHLPEYTKFKNEALRMYPSVPIISIDTTQETTLGNYTLPAGSTLFIMESVMSKNPHFYKNGATFNPHRFEPDNENYTDTTYGHTVTFVHGHRRCLGQWFAQAEARSLIAELIAHNIWLEFVDETDNIRLYMDGTGKPHRTIWARAHSYNAPYTEHQIKDHLFMVTELRNENPAQSIKTLRIAPANGAKLPFSYHPGDHIELFLTKTDSSGEPVTSLRHFSLSSAPTDSNNWLEITVKKETGNTTSTHMHDELAIGDIVELRAPLDDGVRVSEHDAVDQPLVLISGGIGITPMMSVTRYLLAKNWPGDIYFIHSSKTAELLPFYPELHKWENTYDNFHLLVTLTQEPADSNWKGARERLNHELLSTIHPNNKARAYLCGKPEFCSNLSDTIQALLGIEAKNIRQLSFGVADWHKASQNCYTRAEVAEHNQVDDAWMIIDNFVYNVTKYLDFHPGLDIICDYLGKDATEIFNSIPHSAAAKKLLTESDLISIIGVIV